ncbi:unnamed protein product, partial [Prorocentrum cordatum]
FGSRQLLSEAPCRPPRAAFFSIFPWATPGAQDQFSRCTFRPQAPFRGQASPSRPRLRCAASPRRAPSSIGTLLPRRAWRTSSPQPPRPAPRPAGWSLPGSPQLLPCWAGWRPGERRGGPRAAAPQRAPRCPCGAPPRCAPPSPRRSPRRRAPRRRQRRAPRSRWSRRGTSRRERMGWTTTSSSSSSDASPSRRSRSRGSSASPARGPTGSCGEASSSRTATSTRGGSQGLRGRAADLISSPSPRLAARPRALSRLFALLLNVLWGIASVCCCLGQCTVHLWARRRSSPWRCTHIGTDADSRFCLMRPPHLRLCVFFWCVLLFGVAFCLFLISRYLSLCLTLSLPLSPRVQACLFNARQPRGWITPGIELSSGYSCPWAAQRCLSDPFAVVGKRATADTRSETAGGLLVVASMAPLASMGKTYLVSPRRWSLHCRD